MVRSRSESNRRVDPRVRARRSKSDSSIPKKRKRDSEDEPKILGAPIKSPADENEYRIIELSNGLRAILISCLPCVKGPRKIQRNRKCLDKAIVEFNANIVGVQVRDRPKEARPTSSSTSCEKRTTSVGRSRPCKKNHSKGCDCDVTLTGVAVNVGTGNFHEPECYPGLAHLMEHLIYSKYPKCVCLENLDENIVKSENADTRGEHVTYYFAITHHHLTFFLVPFSNLFISPILALKDIPTEREAVDSEYLDSKYTDSNGICRMYQVFMKEGHPAARFIYGSKETLATPDGNDETLRRILLEYLDKDYGAGNMTVSLHGPEPLDVLQKLVVDRFGQIPKRTVKVQPPLPDHLASDPAKFRRLYFIKPHSNMNKLSVAWDIPIRIVLNYETKPLLYFKSLLSSEAPGGLAAYLKKMKWISSVSCSIADAIDNDYSSGLISVDFSLRNTDTEILFQILNALHSYLKFLSGVDPQEWYFNEIRWILSLKFHFFGEHEDPEVNAPVQARNLRNYQPEDCLIGGHLITKWDPRAISSCLELLAPQNTNVMIISKYAGVCNLVEPLFDVRYAVMDDVQYQSWVQKWMTVEPLKEFKFPCPNKFITTEFCGVEPKCARDPGCKSEISKWITVVNSSKMKFCNYKLKSETVCYKIHIDTAVSPYTIENTVLLEIWLELLKRTLSPILYGVEEALLKYAIVVSKKGIVCTVSGFGQHLHLVVLEIFKQIENLHPSVTREMFEDARNDGLDSTRNLILEPYELALLLQHNICYTNMNLSWPAKFKVLTAATFEKFQEFALDFKKRLFIKITGRGDIDQETSLNLANDILEILTYEPLLKSGMIGRDPPVVTTYQLPLGDSILRVRCKNTRSNKATAYCFYQFPAEPDAAEICKILSALMDLPSLHELRRKQNLGYHASVSYRHEACRPNIVIFVDTHSHKFSGTHVKNKMENFVQEFFDNRIQKLTQAEVKDHKDTKVKEYYKTYLLPGPRSEMRKLTIQIVGKADQEFSQKSIQDLSAPFRGHRKPLPIKDTDISITVLTPSPAEEKARCTSQHPQQFIRNISEFKTKLFTYPSPDPED